MPIFKWIGAMLIEMDDTTAIQCVPLMLPCLLQMQNTNGKNTACYSHLFH